MYSIYEEQNGLMCHTPIQQSVLGSWCTSFAHSKDARALWKLCQTILPGEIYSLCGKYLIKGGVLYAWEAMRDVYLVQVSVTV